MSVYLVGLEYTEALRNGLRGKVDSKLTELAKGWGGKPTICGEDLQKDSYFIFQKDSNALEFASEATRKLKKEGVVLGAMYKL